MSPRPQLTFAQVEARRERIVESALDEIARRGPEAVRMKDVAAGAGVSVGAVQYYFATRDELLVQAFSAHSRAVIGAIARLSETEGTAWDRLCATFRAVPVVESHERRSVVWIELVAAARRDALLATAVAEVFARWRGHFRTLIDEGVVEGIFVPQIAVGLIVDTVIAQIDGFDLAVAAGRPGLAPEQITCALEATAATLLGVRSGSGFWVRAVAEAGDR